MAVFFAHDVCDIRLQDDSAAQFGPVLTNLHPPISGQRNVEDDPVVSMALQSSVRPNRRRHAFWKVQVAGLTDSLYKALDKGHDFTAVYLEVTKYFDKIWHEGLLFKCKNDFTFQAHF